MRSRQSCRGWWETLIYTLQDNRDLLAFFEKYRKVAGKALGTELDRLILNMKTGNPEAALRGMDARLGLPSFAALCSVLCGVHQGVDQRTSLLVLEQDMRTKERESTAAADGKTPRSDQGSIFHPDDTAHIALYGSPCNPHHQ